MNLADWSRLVVKKVEAESKEATDQYQFIALATYC
jgi:hypothetical protein